MSLCHRLFATLTNVNFEAERITGYARQAEAYRQQLRRSYEAACQAAGVDVVPSGSTNWLPIRPACWLKRRLQRSIAARAYP